MNWFSRRRTRKEIAWQAARLFRHLMDHPEVELVEVKPRDREAWRRGIRR